MRRGILSFGSIGALLALVAVTGAHAQDLDAGKTGAQLFAQDCSGCHRSPQGLIKTAHAFSLNSFLRQHYTTSARSASELAAYLNSVGASSAASRSRGGTEARSAAGSEGRPAVGGHPWAGGGSEARSPRKKDEPAVAARPGDGPAANDTGRGRKSRRPAAATPAPENPKPSEAAATPPLQPPAPPDTNVWSATAEARMPPPVEPAEPSGLEPGTPVSASPSNKLFSSPIP
jgi:hypothetical protein